MTQMWERGVLKVIGQYKAMLSGRIAQAPGSSVLTTQVW